MVDAILMKLTAINGVEKISCRGGEFMSLKKGIEHGKEHRKMNQPIAPSCRHHGSCPFCSGNRMFHRIKDKEKTKYELKQELSTSGGQELSTSGEGEDLS